MKLPDYVEKAIELLENSKYQAVVVGGAVRDYLLNLSPNDYDISTNALPEETKKVFEKYFTLDTGIKHGTVTVFINHHQIEITTYRNEKDYDDYRHPKKVVFVNDLKSDLTRRDFTINALCFNKEIIDHVDGIKDLNNKIIRAIGEPDQRFMEDPLRILRALRFSSTLGFVIDSKTEESMFKYSYLINKVSVERINVEFNKLLLGKNPDKIILKYLKIINEFIPELNPSIHNLEMMIALDDDLVLKLVALFKELDSKIVYDILKRLKYNNSTIKDVCFYLENIHLELENDSMFLTKLLGIYSYHELKYIIRLKMADNIGQNKTNDQLNSIEKTLDKVYKEKKCFRIKDLKISGSDLIRIGFIEGVKIRIILEAILDEILEGKISNSRDVLLRRAKKFFNEQI